MADHFRPEPGSEDAETRFLDALKGSGIEATRTLQEVLDEYPEDDATEIEETTEYEDDRTRTDVEPAPKLPTTINLFQHPDAHPFVLDLALLRKYGPEWLQWEPETIEDRVLTDFRTNSLSDLTMEKLQAVRVLHLVDGFWADWQVFIPTALALNGIPADFNVVQHTTVPQALVAADIANRIRQDVEWSLEMKTFLSVLFLHEGFFCPIRPLEWVEVDSEDYDVNCEEILSRWDEVRADHKAPESTTVENEQLRRMLDAWDLLEENRKQVDEQLPLIYHA